MDETQAPDATPDATPAAAAADPLPAPGSEPAPDVAPIAPVDGAPVDGEPVDGEPVDGEPVDGEPVDARVVAALERLTSLDELSVDDHVAVYDAAHRDLQEALAEAASRDTTDPA